MAKWGEFFEDDEVLIKAPKESRSRPWFIRRILTRGAVRSEAHAEQLLLGAVAIILVIMVGAIVLLFRTHPRAVQNPNLLLHGATTTQP